MSDELEPLVPPLPEEPLDPPLLPELPLVPESPLLLDEPERPSDEPDPPDEPELLVPPETVEPPEECESPDDPEPLRPDEPLVLLRSSELPRVPDRVVLASLPDEPERPLPELSEDARVSDELPIPGSSPLTWSVDRPDDPEPPLPPRSMPGCSVTASRSSRRGLSLLSFRPRLSRSRS